MRKTRLFAAIATAATLALTGLGIAQDNASATRAYDDIRATLGTVPGHFAAYPPSAVEGAWQMTKGLLLGEGNSLDLKTKSLIAVAVAAQIPCQYCVWLDTKFARQMGATDGEIAAAVAQAGLTRNWSAILNGLQIDFATFKAEFGGD